MPDGTGDDEDLGQAEGPALRVVQTQVLEVDAGVADVVDRKSVV